MESIQLNPVILGSYFWMTTSVQFFTYDLCKVIRGQQSFPPFFQLGSLDRIKKRETNTTVLSGYRHALLSYC